MQGAICSKNEWYTGFVIKVGPILRILKSKFKTTISDSKSNFLVVLPDVLPVVLPVVILV